MAKLSLGLDLGGTKVAGCLCNAQGKILKKAKVPTFQKGQEPADVISAMVDLALSLSEGKAHQLAGIGVASAGPLNVDSGVLLSPINFPGWGTVPLVKKLSNELKNCDLNAPIRFQNDAMAAALGEGWIGAAKKCQSYVAITIGTGIGTGLIINGSPSQTKGIGSEWGHCFVPVSGAKTDTVENHASGTALIKKAKALGFKGKDSFELVQHIKRYPRSKYKKVFIEAAEALGFLCYNLSIGTGLEKIVLAGGLIEEKELFLENLKKTYSRLIKDKMGLYEASICAAKNGAWAGALGAASLTFSDPVQS